MNQIQPSIGRIVHYVDESGQQQPAVITRVWTRECVNLQVLPDCAMPYVKTSVVYDDTDDGERRFDGKPFSWHWPERV